LDRTVPPEDNVSFFNRCCTFQVHY
jgi:hypothetical protein